MVAVRKPDVEFRRRVEAPQGPPGNRNAWRSYGHIYWRPLIVVALGRTLIGRRALRKSWEAHDAR
jgi:hypothetical protein